ncbi:MAG: hypothetical protein ACJAUP_003179 [Cellvibrionaceae bacterium]|jgi:hypothetical protein
MKQFSRSQNDLIVDLNRPPTSSASSCTSTKVFSKASATAITPSASSINSREINHRFHYMRAAMLMEITSDAVRARVFSFGMNGSVWSLTSLLTLIPPCSGSYLAVSSVRQMKKRSGSLNRLRRWPGTTFTCKGRYSSNLSERVADLEQLMSSIEGCLPVQKK